MILPDFRAIIPDDLLRHQEQPGEVDVQHLAPHLSSKLLQGACAAEFPRYSQDVDPADFLLQRRDPLSNSALVDQIRKNDSGGGQALPREWSHGPVQLLGLRALMTTRAPALRQPARDSKPDPLVAPVISATLPVKFERVRFPSVYILPGAAFVAGCTGKESTTRLLDLFTISWMPGIPRIRCRCSSLKFWTRRAGSSPTRDGENILLVAGRRDRRVISLVQPEGVPVPRQ